LLYNVDCGVSPSRFGLDALEGTAEEARVGAGSRLNAAGDRVATASRATIQSSLDGLVVPVVSKNLASIPKHSTVKRCVVRLRGLENAREPGGVGVGRLVSMWRWGDALRDDGCCFKIESWMDESRLEDA